MYKQSENKTIEEKILDEIPVSESDDYSIKIKRVTNGFVAKFIDIDETNVLVYEDMLSSSHIGNDVDLDDIKASHMALARLLEDVKAFFGLHDDTEGRTYNLNLVFEKTKN